VSPFPKQHLTVGGTDPFLPLLLQSINYATHIRIATAFTRMTGYELIQSALAEAAERGARIQIVTGDYLSITDPQALRYLMLLKDAGANVRIFQSDGKISFHMKTYLFERRHGTSLELEDGCAFVGSSNITRSALKQGLEWNLRVDANEDPKRFQTIVSEFDSVYHNERCKDLTHLWIDQYVKRIPEISTSAPTEPGQGETIPIPTPNDVQSNVLDALAVSREQGYRRGLVVMATGLGKTWLSAFDTKAMSAKRVLFVAHREEILEQGEKTFLRIHPSAKVGRYMGRERDVNVDMLFASVQTLGREHHLENFRADYFDYVIVDEFHHAAARTYQRLLGHFAPRFLLGLTATPDRTDQSDILHLCDDNLVYSNDIFDGINAKLLCPFQYYGIGDDSVDYKEISWRNGRFDPNQLYNQLATNARARHNLNVWKEHHQQRTLAFCISKNHAEFMAKYFSRHGVKAVPVHSDSETRRNDALEQLERGLIDVVFSVDLFNEGVDLPAIDTVLMLRPTESKILFLQQLGRGLRQSPETGKKKLVCLDFIGNHISFFRKAEALYNIGATNSARRDFLDKTKEGALELPEGCFVNYDLKALDFMTKLIETRTDQQEDIYRSLRNSMGRRPTLSEFYRAGGAVNTIRKEHGQWLQFVNSEKDLSGDEQACLSSHHGFFAELETTNMTKSFKCILLEALIELDGFRMEPTIDELAKQSFLLLERRRLLQQDLPDEFRSAPEVDNVLPSGWIKYWNKNPVKAWLGGNTNEATTFFHLKNDKFSYSKEVKSELVDVFGLLVQELLSYRLIQYESRLSSKATNTNAENNVVPLAKAEPNSIPYFSDLRIACGYFRTSAHEDENIELQSLPATYGKLDPSRHFIARAAGNSMNGGKHPILDGDLLLLEAVTPSSAGSLTGQIVAIERADVTGDDQFLLRGVKKDETGKRQLIAQNPEFEIIPTTEEMTPFARFKSVIDPLDFHLHKPLTREEIPPLFNLRFNTGLWQSGHVCPKGHSDQFLLVTLNKQGKLKEHQYHDYFIDCDHFHWQSQNSTSTNVARGQAIINHQKNGSRVHLFVRRLKLQGGKGAPFFYCGSVSYKSYEGEKPMSVTWLLDTSLPDYLLEEFK